MSTMAKLEAIFQLLIVIGGCLIECADADPGMTSQFFYILSLKCGKSTIFTENNRNCQITRYQQLPDEIQMTDLVFD